MTILALEFSSAHRSAAVARDNTVLAQAVQAGGSGPAILELVERALGESQLHQEEIQRLVVGLGPGSYTGIRAAIAVAQGWELARGVSLLGIDSMEALARVAWRHGLRGRVAFLVDAQRGEFYVAECDLFDGKPGQPGALRLAGRTEVETLARAGVRLAGPDAAAVGGATLYPDAAALAELAEGRADFIRGDGLQPIYLRPTTFVKAPRVGSCQG